MYLSLGWFLLSTSLVLVSRASSDDFAVLGMGATLPRRLYGDAITLYPLEVPSVVSV